MWGGKRKGSGRNKGQDKNWNDYKKEAKKRKLEDSAKFSMNIKTFFSPRVEVQEQREEIPRKEEEEQQGEKEEEEQYGENEEEEQHGEKEEEEQRNSTLEDEERPLASPLPFF